MSRLAINGGRPIKRTPWPKWPQWEKSTLKAIEGVFKSGRWAISSNYNPDAPLREKAFGKAFAEFLGAKYCVPVTSGSASLELAMEALGIGAYDEVIIPALTWCADAVAVVDVNAVPVFADIDPATLCISPEAVEKAITKKTKAVIAVHLYGSMCDMDALVAICRRKKVHLIEDCSHMHGAQWRGKSAGTFGVVGCFSTQHTKLLAAGEGGVTVTNDAELKSRIEQLKSNSRKYLDRPTPGKLEIEWSGEIMGGNYSMTEFQSAILLDRLGKLKEQTLQREDNAKFLDDELSSIPGFDPIVPPDQVTRRAYYYYVVRCDRKFWKGTDIETVRQALAAELMGGAERIYVPLHKSPLFRPLTKKRHRISKAYVDALKKYLKADLPESDRAHQSCISIPHYALLAERGEMQKIVDAFAKVSEAKCELESK
jgi:L-glutamine:2-deoxy-scyllo-inosose/3-amino-2,3-dideoxy-scyllo-inosose aminotransferase